MRHVRIVLFIVVAAATFGLLATAGDAQPLAADWSISISASAASVPVGTPVTLTATINQLYGPGIPEGSTDGGIAISGTGCGTGGCHICSKSSEGSWKTTCTTVVTSRTAVKGSYSAELWNFYSGARLAVTKDIPVEWVAPPAPSPVPTVVRTPVATSTPTAARTPAATAPPAATASAATRTATPTPAPLAITASSTSPSFVPAVPDGGTDRRSLVDGVTCSSPDECAGAPGYDGIVIITTVVGTTIFITTIAGGTSTTARVPGLTFSTTERTKPQLLEDPTDTVTTQPPGPATMIGPARQGPPEAPDPEHAAVEREADRLERLDNALHRPARPYRWYRAEATVTRGAEQAHRAANDSDVAGGYEYLLDKGPDHAVLILKQVTGVPGRLVSYAYTGAKTYVTTTLTGSAGGRRVAWEIGKAVTGDVLQAGAGHMLGKLGPAIAKNAPAAVVKAAGKLPGKFVDLGGDIGSGAVVDAGSNVTDAPDYLGIKEQQ